MLVLVGESTVTLKMIDDRRWCNGGMERPLAQFRPAPRVKDTDPPPRTADLTLTYSGVVKELALTSLSE